MTQQPTIRMTINLLDEDEEQLDIRTRQLLQEMREWDSVESVTLVTQEISEGTKGFKETLGELLTLVKLDNIKQFFASLGERLRGKPIKVTIKEVGGKEVMIEVYSLAELKAAEQTIIKIYRGMNK